MVAGVVVLRALPLPTIIVVNVSHALAKTWWIVVGFVFAGVYFFKQWLKTEKGRQTFDAFQLKIPLIVRLEGTQSEQGKEILKKSGLNIISGSGLEEAAKKAVACVHSR